ncbi:MAG: tRNA pseudouridine(55) synthase TruB [Ignavibacteriae bacterium]|nr:tRNA pseudouridine(55) synthase TruB [Ignavibacteriota bacterium]
MIITKTTTKINPSELSEGAVLLIDKPKNRSSFFVVNVIRKKFGIKKVGHAGTLDPAATGLLIVCIGKKTKEINQFQEMHKVYSGTITLGASTISMDSETELNNVIEVKNLDENKILEIKNSFVGEIEQVPPMFSALKHKGKSLYKYARKGIEIERNPRKVLIYRFDIKEIKIPDLTFEIECSKGTYIRVIANDFGIKTGFGGYLSELRRTKIGEFKVEDSFTLDEIEKLEFTNN